MGSRQPPAGNSPLQGRSGCVHHNLCPYVFLKKYYILYGKTNLSARCPLHRYARLESSGALQDTLQDPDLSLSSTRPFHDDEIAAAIESLQTSTAAIDAQTGALKSQSQQLRSILMAEKENGIREGKVLGGFRDSNVKESQRINGIVSANLRIGW